MSGINKANASRRQPGSGPPDKRQRKDRNGAVGRALRTVYDDTLREEVPQDFLDLLDKLA